MRDQADANIGKIILKRIPRAYLTEHLVQYLAKPLQ